MKRFTLYTSSYEDNVWLGECEDGEYVEFNDHHQALTAKDEQIRQIQQEKAAIILLLKHIHESAFAFGNGWDKQIKEIVKNNSASKGEPNVQTKP